MNMSSLTDNPLVDGEEIIYRVKLHPIVYLPSAKIAIVLLLCVAGHAAFKDSISGATQHFLDIYGKWFVLAWFTWFGIQFIRDFIRQQFTEIAVTNRRLAIKTGLFATMTWEVPLKQIESTAISRTLLGRLLNYGTVIIHGTGGGDPHIRFVKDPNVFTWHINEGQRKRELADNETAR